MNMKKVDSIYAVMSIEMSDQLFSRKSGLVVELDCMTTGEERVLREVEERSSCSWISC